VWQQDWNSFGFDITAVRLTPYWHFNIVRGNRKVQNPVQVTMLFGYLPLLPSRASFSVSRDMLPPFASSGIFKLTQTMLGQIGIVFNPMPNQLYYLATACLGLLHRGCCALLQLQT